MNVSQKFFVFSSAHEQNKSTLLFLSTVFNHLQHFQNHTFVFTSTSDHNKVGLGLVDFLAETQFDEMFAEN